MNILRLPKLLYSCVAFCCCQALTVSLSAQQQKADTARTYSIPEVTVAEAYHTREVRAMAPTQVFSKEELKSLNVLQVSDAVKHFAGVTVKDYGGIGGLKTVSLRSLGAEHTAVGYDGITISDCQTGQIDIGRFSLDNVDRLSLSNGQSDNIFQPARFFASAGILNIQTLTPQFKDNRRKLSPYVSASFKPFAGEEFRIRLFYKDIFRLPSFNDLYYGQVGNTNLKPESTTQYNLGLTYSRSINELIPYVSVTADAYYNKVKDKIIAIPTKNLFIWSMVNLGKVDIKGIDIAGNISLQPWEKLRVNLSGNYTYQRALDMTEPGGKTYKQQIAYTPRVSGSGQAGIETPWVNLSYSFLFSGKRYMLGQNLRENRLDSYSDHSVSVSRDLRIRNVNTSLTVEVLNLLDKNYEIVKNFPMPGRSVRVTMKVRY
ncbi:TonB-dependent receptor domain-containing protein [Bacteroides fragilis]